MRTQKKDKHGRKEEYYYNGTFCEGDVKSSFAILPHGSITATEIKQGVVIAVLLLVLLWLLPLLWLSLVFA